MPLQSLSLFSFFNIEAREYANFTFDAAARGMTRNVILGLCAVMLLVSLYALYQKYVPGAIVRAILKAKAHSKDTAKTTEELGLEKNPLVLMELKFNLSLKKLLRMANDEGEDPESPVRSLAEDTEEDAIDSELEAEDADADADADVHTEAGEGAEVEAELHADAEVEAAAEADAETDRGAQGEATIPVSEGAAEESAAKEDASYELARFYIPEECKDRAENQFNKAENNPFALLIATGLIFAFGIALIKLLPWILTVFDNFMK